MKKALTFLLGMIMTVTLFAQEQNPSATVNSGNSNRSVTIVQCPENTVYSQTPLNWGGLTSWTGSEFKAYDQVLSDPGSQISALVWYGSFNSGGSPDRNFSIEVHSDNAGVPGALVYSYAAFIQGVFVENISGYNVYSYTYNFPASIPILQGDWISVRADGATTWFWWAASAGGDGCAYQDGPYGFRCDYGDMSFCLVGGAEVPFSPWALAIGIALIATFIIVRARRSF